MRRIDFVNGSAVIQTKFLFWWLCGSYSADTVTEALSNTDENILLTKEAALQLVGESLKFGVAL